MTKVIPSIKFVFLGWVFSLLLTVCAHSQVRSISSEEYLTPYRAARDEQKNLARRYESKIEYFSEGKISSSEEWLQEILPSGDARYLHIEITGDKISRREQINLNGEFFCKKDSGPWERKERGCVGGGIGGFSNIVSREFAAEDVTLSGEKFRKFISKTIYEGPNSNGAHPSGTRLEETFYLLNEKGLIVRRESRERLVKTNDLTRVEIEKYEYDPNIKIEAPIP